MWEQARQGQEGAILRSSSENIGLDSLSITRHVAMTAIPPKDSDHHQTESAHGEMDVSSFSLFRPHVCRTVWPSELKSDLVLVTC